MIEVSRRIHFWCLEGPEMVKNGLKHSFLREVDFRGGRPLSKYFLFIAGPALGRAQGHFIMIFIVTSGAKGPKLS